MSYLPHIITALLAYLLGSIPSGFLTGKAKGLDIRAMGSGNIGATNAFRLLGKAAGSFVLFADALKGFLACVLVPRVAALPFREGNPAPAGDALLLIAGVCAVLGHNYTCWLRFKGGKGIATSAGVLLAWVPMGLLAIFITWLIVFFASRFVSLASIAAAVVLPFAVWWLHGDRGWIYVAITTGLSALAIFKHRPNIRRLLDGTENRIGSSRPPSEARS